ncbi:MAG: DUF3536 domain-containing protein, partial [Gemmatimonadetes bacterium]|nr:DUF3536 domain-containing protein [Gemmatimonadota bacterium]
IAFTILAPHQVEILPKGGLPGLYRTESGRSIALFVYNGPLSHAVAFGPLLKDAAAWAVRLAGKTAQGGEGGDAAAPAAEGVEGPPPRLVSMATDGETYGHHHRFGEMALAAVVQALRSRQGVRLENYASFLAHSPPVEEVTLVEPTSWSCSHGVERWKSDCGCKMHPKKDTQQEWRAGLRTAMEWLAQALHGVHERETSPLMGDPWEARDDYGRVVAGSESLQEFLARRLPKEASATDRIRGAELLEMERNALRLFTSCGWFFDDLAGIEPLQVLRYAARALELAGPSGAGLEAAFLSRLKNAFSNETPPRDGATIFRDEVKPGMPHHVRVAAGDMEKDLPRDAGKSALWDALDRWVPPGEATAVLAEEKTLGQVLSAALVSAVRSLERGGDKGIIPGPADIN